MYGVTISKYPGKGMCIFCQRTAAFNFRADIKYKVDGRSTNNYVCTKCYEDLRKQLEWAEPADKIYDDFDRSGEEWR